MFKKIVIQMLLVFVMLSMGSVEVMAAGTTLELSGDVDGDSVALKNTNELINDTGTLASGLFKLVLFIMGVFVVIVAPFGTYYAAKSKITQSNQQNQDDDSETKVVFKAILAAFVVTILLGALFTTVIHDVVGIGSDKTDAIKTVLFIDKMYS